MDPIERKALERRCLPGGVGRADPPAGRARLSRGENRLIGDEVLLQVADRGHGRGRAGAHRLVALIVNQDLADLGHRDVDVPDLPDLALLKGREALRC